MSESPQSRKHRPTKTEQERRAQLWPEVIKDYLEGDEDPSVLSTRYNIPESTIWKFFKDQGISKQEEAKKESKVLKEIKSGTEQALSLQGQKLATIAIAIGGTIANRYLPLIDGLMGQGMSLERIAEEIMEWYEDKPSTSGRLTALEGQVALLEEQLRQAQLMALPNYIYKLRLNALNKYAMEALRVRAMGIKIDPRTLLIAYNNDLVQIEAQVNKVQETLING